MAHCARHGAGPARPGIAVALPHRIRITVTVTVTENTMSDLPAVAPLPTGLYRHYKGNDYEVVAVAHHSETLEPLVVYRALYGERGLWVRPYAMFREEVIVDGQRVPRFAFVSSDLP